jgi:hypothetical protein
MFSVLLPVYINDNPIQLDRAIRSITTDQILPPTEVVIVQDGPISDDCNDVVSSHKSLSGLKFVLVKIEKNVGLGTALSIGLENCSNDIVFRMDADDISMPNRFEAQFNEIQSRGCDALGAIVAEFFESEDQVTKCRLVPLSTGDAIKYSKWRNPITHPSVVFKKKSVMIAGGYQEMRFFEDYFLWLRMLNKGLVINNLDRVLLKMRAGPLQNSRRSGFKYLKCESRFYISAAKMGLIPFTCAAVNIIVKSPIRMLPRQVLGQLYNSFLRS